MRYFKQELWLGANAPAKARASQDRWMLNLESYRVQLKALQPRLTPGIYRFFTQTSLHDGRLVSLSVGDQVHGRSGNSRWSEPFAVIDAVDAYQKRHHILNYRGIRRLAFDYPSNEPLFHMTCGPIGDWGYDELTAAEDNFLRHEILFSSGTTLLIEFQEIKHHTRGVMQAARG